MNVPFVNIQKSNEISIGVKIKILFLKYNVLNMKIEIESFFDVLQNEKGELMLVVSAKTGDIENPVLLYANDGNALLFRSKCQTIMLNNIHEAVKKQLSDSLQILIAETENKEIKQEYTAEIRTIAELPVFRNYSKEILDRMEEDKAFAEQVLRFYSEMADNGNVEAQYTLALILMEGKLTKEDYYHGLDYLAKAAKQGHEDAEMRYLEETAIDDDGRYDAWV